MLLKNRQKKDAERPSLKQRFSTASETGRLRAGKYTLFFTPTKRIEQNLPWVQTKYTVSIAEILGMKKLLFFIFSLFIDAELLLYGISRPEKLILFSTLTIFAFYLPDLWATQVAARQKRLFNRELPNFIDILALAVDAGYNMQFALEYLQETYEGVFSDPIQKTVREVQLGRPLSQSLEEWKNSMNLPDLQFFLVSILQSMRLGTPLAPVLQAQAQRLRKKRHQRAQELSQSASVKITIPLVLCIFPSLLIIYLAPVIMQFLQSTSF